MTLWHEYWISDICNMKWECVMCTANRPFVTLHELWHVYWTSGICDMIIHDCVTCVLNIRYLCHDMLCDMNTEHHTYLTLHDMTMLHEYLISDICDKTCHFVLSSEYKIFVTWHDKTVWLTTVYQKFVTWHFCAKWVLIIIHLWHDMTVWHEK